MPNVAGQKFPYTPQGVAAADEKRNLLNRGAMGSPTNMLLGGKRTAPQSSLPYSGGGNGGIGNPLLGEANQANRSGPMFPGMAYGGGGLTGGRAPGGGYGQQRSGGHSGSTPPGWNPPMLLPEQPIRVLPQGPNDPYMPDGTPNPEYPVQGPLGPRKRPAADPLSHPSGIPHFPAEGDPGDWTPPSVLPGSPHGPATNPQQQDDDGNWYEWDGHQWKPIMKPKPYNYPGPQLIPSDFNPFRVLPGVLPFHG